MRSPGHARQPSFPHMKRLIVNADDFGMTAGVNRAVIDAFRNGIVTSTSLMATGEALTDALRAADRCPGLRVGCHVVLLEGAPLLGPADIPRLASPDGRFRRRFGAFVKAALTGQLPAREIARETSAQIRKLRQAGIPVSHLDTHKHAHVFPEIFRPVLRAAAECGVKAVRNPFEPIEVMGFADVVTSPALASRLAPVRMLRVFAAEFRRAVREHGLVTTDGTVGITLTGFMSANRFDRLLARLPEGTWELVCHPAYEDEEWRRLGPRPGSGHAELEVVASPEAARKVEAYGIELISYADLICVEQRAAA